MWPTPSEFIAIQFPGLGLVLPRHTERVPGSRADAGVLSIARDANGVEYTVITLLRGFADDQVDALCRDIGDAYGKPAEVLRRGKLEAVVRYHWAMRDVQSPMLRALARIRRSFGQVWTHVEGGRMTLYAPVVGGSAAKAAERLAEHLTHLGLPAPVEVVRLRPAEQAAFAHLQELVAEPAFQP